MPGQADLTFTINADEAQAANAFRALSNDANGDVAAKVISSFRLCVCSGKRRRLKHYSGNEAQR
jgi:hypothetical protein